MKLFANSFERLTLLLAWLAAWLFVASGIMLSYEVVARYFFLAPTKWAARAISALFNLWNVIILMLVTSEPTTYQINAITSLLNEKVQRLVGILTMAVLIWFSVFIVIYGWNIFYDSFGRGRTTGSLLDLPSWIAEVPVPVLFAFLAVQAIIEIWKLASGEAIPTEVMNETSSDTRRHVCTTTCKFTSSLFIG